MEIGDLQMDLESEIDLLSVIPIHIKSFYLSALHLEILFGIDTYSGAHW